MSILEDKKEAFPNLKVGKTLVKTGCVPIKGTEGKMNNELNYLKTKIKILEVELENVTVLKGIYRSSWLELYNLMNYMSKQDFWKESIKEYKKKE